MPSNRWQFLSESIEVSLHARNPDVPDSPPPTDPLPLTFAYDTYEGKTWDAGGGSPITLKNVQLPIAPDWADLTIYAVGDIVRSGVGLAYRCTVAHTSEFGTNDPGPGSTEWELIPPFNTAYVQATLMGSADAINAMLVVPTESVNDSGEAVHPKPVRDVALDRLGRSDKQNLDWADGRVYEEGDHIVFVDSVLGPKHYICIDRHTSSSGSNEPEVDGTSEWRRGFIGGPERDVDLPPDPPKNQIIFRNDDGAILHVGELAHIAIVGPYATQTIQQQWAALGSPVNVSEWMLAIDPNGTTDRVGDQSDDPDSLKVPHAFVLLDRFTTVSPLEDDLDNDGDDDGDSINILIDEPDELLVPGTINLNTAPEHLLRKVLPIANEAVRNRVIQAIIEYRERRSGVSAQFGFDATDRGYNSEYRDRLGIAYLGELLAARPPAGGSDGIAILTNSDPATQGDSFKLGPDSASDIQKTIIDFNVDFDGDGMPDPDGIADDREEEVMIAKWLGQVGSVRSDFFCAYVQIRGYPADDFREGPVETKRFYAIFDRSAVVNGRRDEIRVLAVRELN